jgi:hypothetical protein
MNNYYRTGLFEDAIVSLSRCQEEVSRFRVDPHALKWVLLSLHSTIQGFMALVLEQGNGLSLMTAKDAKAWLEAHDQRKPHPQSSRMDTFLNLYKKIKQTEMMVGMIGAEPFKPNGHDAHMKSLNSLRNDFIHFTLSGWSIEVSGLNGLIEQMMDIVDFCHRSILFPWQRYNNADKYRSEIQSSVSRIRTECKVPFDLAQTTQCEAD